MRLSNLAIPLLATASASGARPASRSTPSRTSVPRWGDPSPRAKFAGGDVARTADAGAGAAAARGVRGGGGGTATMTNEMFNMVKAVVGVGVLSLPAGVAAFGDAPSAVVPAAILISTIGAIAAYNFSLLGMVLGDTFSALFRTFGFSVSRETALVGLTLTVLLPLCLLKNLSSLAPFSLAGIAGMLYTAGAMAIRFFDGSYASADSGFAMDVAESLRPSIGTKGASAVFSSNAFILICMLSTAYMAHFNAAKFYLELEDNTIARWNTVVATSFSISILFFIAIACMGFLTFGGAANGLILNNYSTNDALMGFSRVAVAFALVFTFPLAFVGCRDGVLEMLKVPAEERTDAKLNNLTYIILGGVTAVAMKVKDLSFLMAFGGATLGNALIYVYPAIMLKSAVKNMGEDATTAQKMEVYLAMAFAALGIGMGCIGAKQALGW